MATESLLHQLLGDFESAQMPLHANSSYYDGTSRPTTIGLSVPSKMWSLFTPLAWGRTYVGAVSNRLDVEGFRLADAGESDDLLWRWWQANDMDEKSALGHTEALIHGISYAIVSAPDPDDPMADPESPLIEVESPSRVWADIDPRTGRVRAAVRVVKLSTKAYGNREPDYVTVYTPTTTTGYWNRGQNGWEADFHVDHNLGVVPVVPIRYRTKLSEIYGSSLITPEFRGLIDSGSRLMMQMQATAELMAIPQRLLFGVDPEELTDDPTNKAKVFEAYIARILAFKDPDGKAQQFLAAELRNFADGHEVLAKEAVSLTGLPPDYFSIMRDNPASADAIRAGEARLVKQGERVQRLFGSGWEQVMRVCLLVMGHKLTDSHRRMEAVWRDASTPTFAAKADAVTKLVAVQTADGDPLLPTEAAREELGYSETRRKYLDKLTRQSPRGRVTDLYGEAPGPETRTDREES